LEARALLADSYEQQGYQAESAIWRNMFLVGAKELRAGVPPLQFAVGIDIVAAMPSDLMLDSVATRLDPAVIGNRAMALNFTFTDRNETAAVSISNAVLVSEMGQAHAKPNATLSGPRRLFLGMFFLKTPLAALEAAGLKVEGDRAAVAALQAAIETPPAGFNIAEP
jgi:alkyl sulfatase BDS1-like metallo-beta-lactamase superfamily hydrolase